MCVIVVKPAGKDFPESIMRECWKSNPDGAGFMFTENDTVVVRKGYMKLKKLRKAWNDYKRQLIAKDVVFHFRIATSGLVNSAMCHPFQVSSTLGLAHNGILPIDVPITSDESDTAIMAKQFGVDHVTIHSDFSPIEKWMGLNNKIALLGGNGDLILLNRTAWKDHAGLIFSNLDWQWVASRWCSDSKWSDHRWSYRAYTQHRSTDAPTAPTDAVEELEDGHFSSYERCTDCDEYFDQYLLPYEMWDTGCSVCPDCLKWQAQTLL